MQPIHLLPPQDVPEHPFLHLKTGIIWQVVLQAVSSWCVPVLASQPSIPTRNTSKGAGSPGGVPAVLGPHLAALGKPPGHNTEHPPKEAPL